MYKAKIIITTLICILTGIFLSVDIGAESGNYGIDKLYDAVPDSAKTYIDEKNIMPDGSGISDLKLEDVLNYVISLIKDNIKRPASMFLSITGVIILTSLLEGFTNSTNTSVSTALSLVSTLSATIIISSYLSDSLDDINAAISSASNFTLTYIPVLAGVIAVGGHTSTAAVFSSVMMVSVEILMQITANILFPMTSCIIGISAAGGLNKDLNIDKLGEGIKKIIVWGLGFSMTIFIGFLTLQSNITASADSVGLRAARFAVSTSVPFVGSAVSDALSTVKTSIEVLKSGIGSFGIITGACVLFPVLINAVCYKLFLFISGILCDIFGTSDAGRMIKCGENALSIVISMLICMFLFITISTTLMLLICRN